MIENNTPWRGTGFGGVTYVTWKIIILPYFALELGDSPVLVTVLKDR